MPDALTACAAAAAFSASALAVNCKAARTVSDLVAQGDCGNIKRRTVAIACSISGGRKKVYRLAALVVGIIGFSIG
jgi:hypothetical protein